MYRGPAARESGVAGLQDSPMDNTNNKHNNVIIIMKIMIDNYNLILIIVIRTIYRWHRNHRPQPPNI